MNITLVKEVAPTYKGHESPRYTVLGSKGSIETRRYESVLLAEVEVQGDRDTAINAGFRILAGFIFGNNASKAKIAMTTPVNQTSLINGWKVHFMMPSHYLLEMLPLPNDARIKFMTTKPAKKIVIKFTGLFTDKNLNKHLEILEEYIKENGLKVKGEPHYLYYDPPWTLPFMRRNEISFILDTEENK